MKFPPDNKIKYGQDFSQHVGVPSGVDFEIEKAEDTISYAYELTGPGYGGEPYGCGKMYVWGLTDEEAQLFGEPPRNRFSLLDIRENVT